ncbi:MAG: flavodoxin family protein [Deltaproteobacteria bacterium]|nr:flavodoxin family protein [Deltaproteobacteria bacterium]
MRILAFNGSPRKQGNTSAIIGSMLEGARSEGAQTTEVRLHDIGMKGCMGCLSCRDNPGFCKQRDGLSEHLEAVKTCDGIVIGCPIYMYRICGQMKLFVDRVYSLYANRPEGGYDAMVPPGKTYALVISQGAPDPNQYARSIRWLAGMTGTGLGMVPVGQIIHTNSDAEPAREDTKRLEEAFRIGRTLVAR